MPDIVDTAMSAGTFTTLVAAITAAGLDTALKSPGPFTVFAPSDDAFSKLPSGTVESLLEDLPTLRKILEYHVVSGKVLAADVVKLTKATTTEGEDVEINASSGSVKINGATVTIPDVEAENGVIHVIDTVLLPGSISL
ncbi:fasciclin domain-containing protein [Phormidesmis priestleyi ULC007]|uniref:Fasciclin domain-containing protein n=1 Tax=Phormidesmis priestleyi ULC007 TaxID=1920490 RepID=A0A2T1DFB1_9CYAN|nr:fasciclin domain-containing protein [Phormidesmis priestleyi]PSB19143.1 fasciclin domain-containing protein [Phormidesmis priestleyi ULC007]PZO49995.1 MAG: fasciclin domain-containing protein [Phormidesmis priestleyi]